MWVLNINFSVSWRESLVTTYVRQAKELTENSSPAFVEWPHYVCLGIGEALISLCLLISSMKCRS